MLRAILVVVSDDVIVDEIVAGFPSGLRKSFPFDEIIHSLISVV